MKRRRILKDIFESRKLRQSHLFVFNLKKRVPCFFFFFEGERVQFHVFSPLILLIIIVTSYINFHFSIFVVPNTFSLSLFRLIRHSVLVHSLNIFRSSSHTVVVYPRMKMDRWIKAAMADDSMVVDLLLLLRKNSTSSSSSSDVVAQLKWGVRQPRSTPFCSSSGGGRKRKVVSSVVSGCVGGCRERCFRGSPTTPLSWSGGPSSASTPSPSATADFVNEASSLPSSRSKVNVAVETATASSKRSRKKKIKTYSQLQEEEIMFLKESTILKKEIARLHESLEEQEARSQKLKRIRLDLNLQSIKKPLLDEPEGKSHVTHPGPCSVGVDTLCKQRGGFVLPDLNMTPSDQDSAP